MSRRHPLPPHERRALRLAAWGGGPGAVGFADGMDVLPPDPPVDRTAARLYHTGYQLALEHRRGQRAAAGEA